MDASTSIKLLALKKAELVTADVQADEQADDVEATPTLRDRLQNWGSD